MTQQEIQQYAAAIDQVLSQMHPTHWPRINEKAYHFGVLEFITPVLFDIGVFMIVYGFSVGAVTAVARAEVRQARLRERARQQRRHDVERSIHVDHTEEVTP